MLILQISTIETIWNSGGPIDHGSHNSKAFDAYLGDTIEIEFDSDLPVDLIMTSEVGYNQYLDPLEDTFEYYLRGSLVETSSANLSFVVPAGGRYVFIIDNSEIPDIGAQPVGLVNYTCDIERIEGSVADGFEFIVALCVMTFVIVLIVGLVLARRYILKPAMEQTPTYEHSPVIGESEVQRPMNCPACGTYSSRGRYCTKCGRRLR
jgi:hypothetical protein